MMSMLAEHYNGEWPLWLSPRQVCILPVSAPFAAYADTVARKLRDSKIYVDVDSADIPLGKRLRNLQNLQYNYIVVVGANEQEQGTLSIRVRGQEGKLTTAS